MGNWNILMLAIVIGLFFAGVAFILAQINVTNPIAGNEQSVLSLILSWKKPF